MDLAKIDSYERRNQDRSTVLGRLSALRGTEPWPGYDELTVSEIQVVLANDDDDDLVSEVRGYERSRKDRAGVLRATERETVNS